MNPICTHCLHATISYVQGRERVGCHRARILPDGTVMRPPAEGFEAVVERLPESDLDWRKSGDRCGPDAKHFKEAT